MREVKEVMTIPASLYFSLDLSWVASPQGS